MRSSRSNHSAFSTGGSSAGCPDLPRSVRATSVLGGDSQASTRAGGMNRKMRRATKRNSRVRNSDLAGRLNQGRTGSSSAVTLLFIQAMQSCESGQLSEAMGLYDQIISLEPDIPEVHCNRGAALAGLGRLEDAAAANRRAIALNPYFPDAHNDLGGIYWRLGRFNEAEAACRQAIALKPDHAGAHLNLGNALLAQNRLIEAVEAYRRAIALKPDNASAYNSLGVTLKYLGRLPDAREAAEQATRLAPQNPSYFHNLSDVRQFEPEDPYLRAMEDLAQNIASLPINQQIELHFALAKAYGDVGRNHDSFQQLLAGNALKRRQIVYDETATLAEFRRIRAEFTPEVMRTFRGVGESSTVPIFIIGMPRSGTTLIEQILASHPQVFGAGELPNFGNPSTGLGATENFVSPSPDVMPNMWGDYLRTLGESYVSEITRLAPAATRIVNKMPSNFLLAGLIHLALPNARFIHAVRDPVATCVSCFSRLFVDGQHYTYDLPELGRYYRHYQALMEDWRRILPPGHILDVRYEDVVADLEGQARRMFAHCGVEWDARCLAFHKTERPVYTASTAQVRQPLYQSAVGRWRAFEPFLGPLLAALR